MERVHVERSPAHCPLCKGDLEDLLRVVACAACGARHHDTCRAEHGSCATCGESALLAPRPARRRLEPIPGSAITVHQEGDRAVIRWPVEPQPLSPLAGATTVVWAIAGAAVAFSSALFVQGGNLAQGVAIALIALVAVAATIALRWRFRAPVRPEIALGPDTIELPAVDPVFQIPFPVRAARSQVGTVRTVRVARGTGYSLVVDTGLERRRVMIEVSPSGSRLGEPELDWLAGVIAAWRDGEVEVRDRTAPSPGESSKS